jgi:hypothetical protein
MSERMAASKQAFRDYLKSFDRTKFGAGSEKDPPTDRFSGLDVRKTFDEGLAKGLSKEDSARAVLDYASAVRGKTKMGGATERELNRLLGYLSDEPREEEEQNAGTPSTELAPGEYDFGDPNRPGGFAGSYYDFLGGDPSDPANYFDANLLGDDARGSRGIMRAVFDNRTVRPVPVGRGSFMSPMQIQVPEDLIGDEREEFLAAALAELGMLEPGVIEGGNVGMVDNEATRALNELTEGFYS